MRQLTFRGFLKRYISHLSNAPDLRISNLVSDVLSGNARLIEPLFVYAKTEGRDGRLRVLLVGTELEEAFHEFEQAYAAHSHDLSQIGMRYAKLYNSYLAIRDLALTEKRLKELMRIKTLAAVEEGQISMYRLCQLFNLNAGNLFAFLKQGNLNAVSIDKARELATYVSQ